MTPQRAKELLPIIAAFAEGKTIQWLDDSEKPRLWRDFHASNISFEPELVTFRIKPKPREFWIVVWSDNSYTAYTCKQSCNCKEQIHVIEKL